MDFAKLTVPKMKKELEKLGLPTTGIKSDLLSRLLKSNEKDIKMPVSPSLTPTSVSMMPSATKSTKDGSPTKRKAKELFPEEVGGIAPNDDSEEAKDVPVYLYNKVEYSQKGESELSPAEATVFNFIWRNVKIPSDFERNARYGSLSGSSYEERAIVAFAHGLFDDEATAHLSPLARQLQPVIHKAVFSGDLDIAAQALRDGEPHGEDAEA
mmetsp:Transcript_69126/g.139052  ORF Transcript_69126/g.139052 Transcript_69126/m.139052 type:complete len:211 (-) Transcript_69126:199-831(-)